MLDLHFLLFYQPMKEVCPRRAGRKYHDLKDMGVLAVTLRTQELVPLLPCCRGAADGAMEQEMHKALNQQPEYALLGVGAADTPHSLFPTGLDEIHAFNGVDEQEGPVFSPVRFNFT